MPIPPRIALAAALAIVAHPAAKGQVPPPDPTRPPIVLTTPAQGPGQDVRLARDLAAEVRRLADDLVTDLGNTPQGRHAAEDARELSQAIDEFRANRREGADPIVVRQSYAGLHASWEHLRAQLSRPGTATPVLERDLARIDGMENSLAQAIGLNPLPDGYYAQAPPPPNYGARRLAHALVERAEALALAAQQDLGADPRSVGLVTDLRSLAREADAWQDGLAVNTSPEAAARSFGPVGVLSRRIDRVVTRRGLPPRVQAAWGQFASVEAMVQKELGIAGPAPTVSVTVPGVAVVSAPAVVPTTNTLVPLADQLVQQTTDFVRVFGPTAGVVPEGRFMLADAQRMAAAAAAFRDAVRGGADLNAAALAFRDADVFWSRLARRVNRIARGRMGPNIRQVGLIGQTCSQIHNALGLSGSVPMIVVQP